VRIIAGAHRGRALRAPRGVETRPTSDRVREALFSILGELSGLRVLDLFAGSGALGLEALSRGAAAVDFVDRSRDAIEAVRANLAGLGVAATTHRADALAYLRNARDASRQYDLAFLDPPYRRAAGLGAELSTALLPVLAPGARVVGESDRRSPLELQMPLTDEHRYGDTLIRIHRAP